MSTPDGIQLSTTRAYNPANGKWLNVDPIREQGGINLYGYVGGNPLEGSDPLGLFDLRDAAGFVPVLGSGLDAYDAFKCGNVGMGVLNTALALMDLTGGGALIKGLGVGTMKWGEREIIWRAFLNTKNWDLMRKRLQRANVLPINSMGNPNRDWDTVDHIIKQDWGWPR